MCAGVSLPTVNFDCLQFDLLIKKSFSMRFFVTALIIRVIFHELCRELIEERWVVVPIAIIRKKHWQSALKKFEMEN